MLKRIRALLGRRGSPSSAGARAKTEEARPEGGGAGAEPAVHYGPKVVHWPIATSDLDPDAVKIVRRLTRFDHQAYLVGGCVRDLLLDRKPKDFDVGTSATPRQIKRVFRNSRIIGRRFRLAHIYFQNGKIIEVATFRASDEQDEASAESSTQDLLIRDDNVFGTPEEDALRRDFTINSLFYDLGDQTVLDHADGLGDLRRKLVRTIGEPDIRFREDPIRILRAIKFAARLDFEIERETLASLKKTRHELDKAATPRVLEEINRFCRGGAARRSFELMDTSDVFEVVFPEIAEAYARDRRAWTLMLDLLGRMDETRSDGRREIRTGEIFAAILVPLIAPAFGWKADGTATRPRGLNVRHVIDELLRPIALRLRVPRREQEHARQILSTLFRMVPAANIRRSSKRALLKRECLPDALWILGLLADRLDEDFRVAQEFWSSRPPAVQAPAAPPHKATPQRGRSRRGRRRPRSGSRASSGAAEGRPRGAHESAAAVDGKHVKKKDMPSPWDDGYFFAALPSAPDDGADETRRETTPAAPVASGDAGEAAGPEGKRKKRPRRRRRKSVAARSSSPEGAADADDDGPTTDE